MVRDSPLQRWNMALNAFIHEVLEVFKDRYHKHQTSWAPETNRTSGRLCRKFQGDKKNFSQVEQEQMFYRNSSRSLANFCPSFHEKPTDVLAAHLLPFGKTALPRLLGTACGCSTRTSSSCLGWAQGGSQVLQGAQRARQGGLRVRELSTLPQLWTG